MLLYLVENFKNPCRAEGKCRVIILLVGHCVCEVLCNMAFPVYACWVSFYLTSIFLTTAISSTKHSGSHQAAIRANTGFLADQANIDLLKHIAGSAWTRPEDEEQYINVFKIIAEMKLWRRY